MPTTKTPRAKKLPPTEGYSLPGHASDCMCNRCIEFDFCETVRRNGLDPAAYSRVPVLEAARRATGATSRSTAAAPPTRTRRENPWTPAQKGAIVRLLATGIAPGLRTSIEAQIEGPISSRRASVLIEMLRAAAGSISPRQLELVENLLETRDFELPAATADRLSADQASAVIDQLFRTAPRPKELLHPEAVDARSPEGFYEKDGQVWKVQKSVQDPRNYYAKKWLVDTEEWEYTPGAINRLNESMRMSLEAAKAFGKLYQFCIRCSRRLTDEYSINNGIGRTCAKKW